MSRNCSGAISTAMLAVALAGCGGETEQAADAVASLQLEALGAPDIEQHEIYGTVCGFREAGGSIRALALIQPEQAWIKLDGEAVSLSVEQGQGEGPNGIGLLYVGEQAMLSITPSGEARDSGGGRSEIESGLTVRMRNGDMTELDGSLQCATGSS